MRIDRHKNAALLTALVCSVPQLGCNGGGGGGNSATASESDTAQTESGSASMGTESGPTPGGTDSSDEGETHEGETGAPDPEGEGPSEFPLGRRIRRLTADQYVRSLEVATGQLWQGYEEFASALGRADFAEITSHDTTLSVTFDKFAHDAALATCRLAVADDVTNGSQAILRHATVDAAEQDATRENIAYLMLRFLAVPANPDDTRVDPWAAIIDAPFTTEAPEAEVLEERWVAVCVGFATHVDFVTY